MDDDFGDGNPERNGILRLDGMRESDAVGAAILEASLVVRRVFSGLGPVMVARLW